MPTDEELLSRQMPHNVEAEQAVLGSILIDSECLPQIVEQLKPDDFYIRCGWTAPIRRASQENTSSSSWT